MSTGIHAAVLAPDDVTVHSWTGACEGSLRSLREPQAEASGGSLSAGGSPVGAGRTGQGLAREEGSAVVLFPSPDAVELSSLDLKRIKHIVVVESKVSSSLRHTGTLSRQKMENVTCMQAVPEVAVLSCV